MARKTIDESKLTRMEVRKLNALRKSIGDELGVRIFLEWYRTRPEPGVAATSDKVVAAIAEAVGQLIADGRIKSLPRGGYVVKRGRGRVIVEAAQNT